MNVGAQRRRSEEKSRISIFVPAACVCGNETNARQRKPERLHVASLCKEISEEDIDQSLRFAAIQPQQKTRS